MNGEQKAAEVCVGKRSRESCCSKRACTADFRNDEPKILLEKISENPDMVYKISPRQFEEVVFKILDNLGFDVTLTKQSHDGGKDLIITQKSVLGEYVTYVECKKFRRDRPVSIGIVKELYGTVLGDSVTAGLIITTSLFSKEAIQFAEMHKARMTLRSFNELLKYYLEKTEKYDSNGNQSVTDESPSGKK